MNLLPVAAPSIPGGPPGSDDPAATGSGDFTALLAMLVSAASTTLPLDRPAEEPAASQEPSEGPSTLPPVAVPLLELPAQDRPVRQAGPAPIVPAAADHGGVPGVPAPDGPRASEPAPFTAAPAVAVQIAGRAAQAVPEAVAEIQAEVAEPRPGQPAHPRDAKPAVAPPSPDREVSDIVEPPAGPPASTLVEGKVAPAPARREMPGTAASLPAPAVPVQTPVAAPDAPEPEQAEGHVPAKIDVVPSASQGGAHPVVPLVAANRAEALTPLDVPAAAPVELPRVPDQIVSAVVPLHGRGDGRHEVTLELRPDDLGTIRVEVSVDQQTVHLTLHAAEPATSRLLSAALPDLRAALADAGLTAGQVGVGLDGGGHTGHRRQMNDGHDRDLARPSGDGGSPAVAATDTEPVRTLRPAAAGRLDLFL